MLNSEIDDHLWVWTQYSGCHANLIAFKSALKPQKENKNLNLTLQFINNAGNIQGDKKQNWPVPKIWLWLSVLNWKWKWKWHSVSLLTFGHVSSSQYMVWRARRRELDDHIGPFYALLVGLKMLIAQLGCLQTHTGVFGGQTVTLCQYLQGLSKLHKLQ